LLSNLLKLKRVPRVEPWISAIPKGAVVFGKLTDDSDSQKHPASIFLLWQNIIKKGYARQDALEGVINGGDVYGRAGLKGLP
jgi:hypothetical protein